MIVERMCMVVLANLSNALEQFGSLSLKMFLLFTLFGLCIVAIIMTILKFANRKILFSDILSGTALSIYGSVMIQLTLVCRDSGSRIGYDFDLFHGLFGLNGELRTMMWIYLILNYLFFIPFGFIISLFSVINARKPGIQCLSVTLISFMVSMMIECLQLMTQRGYFEIQDLAVNTLGGISGWVLFRVISLLFMKSRNKHKR